MAITHRVVAAALGAPLALLLAGCGGSTGSVAAQSDLTQSAVPVAHGADSGEGAYLAVDVDSVAFFRWTADDSGSLSGIYDYATANPTEAAGSTSREFTVTGTRHGSSVLLTVGSNTLTGTISDNTLTVNVPQDGGQLVAQQFHRASIDEYNRAVAGLQAGGQAVADQQARAAADAAQQAQQAKDQRALQNALTTLNTDSDFSVDLTDLAKDVKKTDADLAQTRTDAAKGPGEDCYNVGQGVTYDAEQKVGYDAEQEIGYDLDYNFGPRISAVRQEISDLQAAADRVRADGLPVPSTATGAISSARSAIATAISKANKAADRANADVTAAYGIARGMATGACNGDGPGDPPHLDHLS
jgi:hypothetical protein